MLSNKTEFQQIKSRVEEVECDGNCQLLKKSTIQNSKLRNPTQKNDIAYSFGTIERYQLDVLVVRALCANGIPFNVLRNPEWIAMMRGISHGPSDYKLSSFDKARTTLLDEVHRKLTRVLAPMKDTCGSTFLYADDFSGVKKSGKKLVNFLLKSVDEFGPSNILKIITDNASNCKVVGKEIEKTSTIHLNG
ncbi:hypothetical protein vseg_008013 [Gypsophila vaccaria]